nr:MAG TPA: hypothetical protein [Caudoviricetes sp.]
MNDKEGRKWLLQKLYDRGFKFIYYSAGMGGYLTTKQPPKFEGNRTYVSGDFERIDLLSDLLPDFNEPNYLDIGKYLGIVDWSKVAVDTPIIINNKSKSLKRYFAEYDGVNVHYFGFGATSWSAASTTHIESNNVKLAGVYNEK